MRHFLFSMFPMAPDENEGEEVSKGCKCPHLVDDVDKMGQFSLSKPHIWSGDVGIAAVLCSDRGPVRTMSHIKRLPCRRDAWDGRLVSALGIGPSWPGRENFSFLFFFLADGAHRGAGIGIQNLAVLSASGKYLQRDEVSA